MKLYKETLLSEDDSSLNILSYDPNFRHKVTEASELVQNNLRSVQPKMKERCDKYTQSRSFQPGDQVLALLPVPGKPLQARYFGPYIVKEKVSDLNYIVGTPDRRKNSQLCHINMLISYVNRDKSNFVQCANTVSPVPRNCNNVCDTHRIHRTVKMKFLVFRIFKIRIFFVTWTRNCNT